MKYRIKIVTFSTGRKSYLPQFRTWFYWTGLLSDGEQGYNGEYDDRETAIRAIDLHYAGNHKKQTIEFQYIIK